MKSISNTLANNGYQPPTRQQIAIAAFHLYVENGSQHGHDLDDWLRAEVLLMQKAKEIARDQVSEPKPKTVDRQLETYPVETREHPMARDERGSASREEIRQKLPPRRPVSRHLQWHDKRNAHAKSAV
jgi:hypothetical protein